MKPKSSKEFFDTEHTSIMFIYSFDGKKERKLAKKKTVTSIYPCNSGL